jgi:hypothetical protein
MSHESEKEEHFRFHLSLAIFAVVLSVSFFGCASINRVREAQDAFNQGAASENNQRFDRDPSVATAALAAARSSYASALLSLTKIDNRDKEQLIRDDLWGTVLTLKALCQWRLGHYDDALATSSEARGKTTGSLFPRDRAILVALPGLIKTDQAYEKTLRKGPLDDIATLLVGPRGAVVDIQNGRASIDSDHGVQLYLIQAQLAAYRNYAVALNLIGNKPLPGEDRETVRAEIRELDRLVRIHSPGEGGSSIVLYWRTLFGIGP